MANDKPLGGSTLKITITGTPTLIPQLTTLSTILDGTSAEVDVTDMDDTYMQTVSGLLNNGKLTASGFWDPNNAAHQAMRSQWISKAEAVFLVTLSNTEASTIETTGPITQFKCTGGGYNSLMVWEMQQKINSVSITV